MQFRDFLPVSTNTSVKESCYGALGALIGALAMLPFAFLASPPSSAAERDYYSGRID